MKLPMMELGRGPRLAAALAVLCAPASAAQLRRGAMAAEPSAAEANLAPMLLDFTEELKAGVASGAESADAVTSWCKEARGTKAGMLSVLQRQLDETSIALKQVALEQQRLDSEAKLVDAALQEQRQRLAEATSSGDVAVETFKAESSRLNKALTVASRAEEMLSQRQSQQSDAASEDDASQDVPLEDEVGSSFEFSEAQQMLQQLRTMRTKLAQEQSVETSQHSASLQKMAAFQDHLNASLMDSVSQVASIGVETSRRKRESARLRARHAGLEALLGAVRTSAKATDEVCSEEDLHQGELGEAVTGEKKAVASLLRSLRPGASVDDQEATALVQLSSSVELSGAAALRGAALELRGLARRFPGVASILQETARRRGVNFDLAAGVDSPGAAAAREATGNPLANIEDFVRGDRHGGSAEDSARRYIRELYTNLVGDVRRQAVSFADQRRQCSALARDAGVDEAALSRSYKTVEARLHMTKAAMAEYNRTASYYEAQGTAVSEQLEALRAIATKADDLAGTEGARLAGFAQRLLSLISSQGSADDGSTTAQALAQHVEEHRAQLQQRARRLKKQVDSVAQTDAPLIAFLQEEAKHSRRLLQQASEESELLESRVQAKADDLKLGQHFVRMVSKLCTPQKLKVLSDHTEELQRLGGELRKLASHDRKLAATAGDQLGEAELAALLK